MMTFKDVEFVGGADSTLMGGGYCNQDYFINFSNDYSLWLNLDDYDLSMSIVAEEIDNFVASYGETISEEEINKAVKALNECVKQHPNLTYDIQFDDDYNSMSEGFALSLEEAKDYIKTNNGSNRGYFGSFKSGIVSIYCRETGECVYEEEIRHSDDKEEEFQGYQI